MDTKRDESGRKEMNWCLDLNASEMWTVSNTNMKIVSVMWLWIKISCTENVSKAEVVKSDQCNINTTRQENRQLGQVLRHNVIWW